MATRRRPSRSTLVTGWGASTEDRDGPLGLAGFFANAACAARSAGVAAAPPARSARRAMCLPCGVAAAAPDAATATVTSERARAGRTERGEEPSRNMPRTPPKAGPRGPPRGKEEAITCA